MKGVLAIGGSYGSYRILSQILSSLPEDFETPVVATLHLGSFQASQDMAMLLSKSSPLNVKIASLGDSIQAGLAILAPADYHLLVEPEGDIALSRDPQVNYCRPSIDVLFESLVFCSLGPVTALLLSGANEDGARGLSRLEACGARILIQDPSTALAPTMPKAGIKRTKHPEIVPLAQISARIASGR